MVPMLKATLGPAWATMTGSALLFHIGREIEWSVADSSMCSGYTLVSRLVNPGVPVSVADLLTVAVEPELTGTRVVDALITVKRGAASTPGAHRMPEAASRIATVRRTTRNSGCMRTSQSYRTGSRSLKVGRTRACLGKCKKIATKMDLHSGGPFGYASRAGPPMDR